MCTLVSDQGDAAIVSDAAGGFIVAWQGSRDGDLDVYAQRFDANGNRLWPATGVPLAATAGGQYDVSLVGDGQSGAIVAWEDGRAGNTDVYANRVFSVGGVLDVGSGPAPSSARLSLASSNPTRGDARMRLDLPRSAAVSAEVLDLSGRRVRSLLARAELDAGVHLVTWNGLEMPALARLRACISCEPSPARRRL